MFCWKMYNLDVLVKLKNRLKHEVAMNKKKVPTACTIDYSSCEWVHTVSLIFWVFYRKQKFRYCLRKFFKLHVCSWFWSWPKKSIFLLPPPFFRCVYCACRMCYWFPFSYECTDLLWLFSMDWIKYCAVSSGGSAHPPGSSHSVCWGLGRW